MYLNFGINKMFKCHGLLFLFRGTKGYPIEIIPL